MTIEIKPIKEWFSAEELTGLPGMRKTRFGIHLSMRKAIHKRSNPSGKGIEYNLFDLPRETQEFILKTNMVNK